MNAKTLRISMLTSGIKNQLGPKLDKKAKKPAVEAATQQPLSQPFDPLTQRNYKRVSG